MTDPSAWDDVRRQTAAEMLPRLRDLVDECVVYINAHQPELASDPELAAGLQSSAYDNFEQIFRMLADGSPVFEASAPAGAIDYAEIMVKRGQPLQTLLRAYRLGTMYFWRLWRREFVTRIDDPDELMQAVDHSMQFVFDYVDAIAEEVTEEYAVQRERWARSAAALRHETVVRLLSGEGIDLDVATQRLSYDLRRRHLGLVLWTHPEHEAEDVIHRLEQGARRLAASMGAPRPLLVPDGRTTLWAWIGFEDEPDPDLLDHAARDSDALRGLHAATGEVEDGIRGFVDTHTEALRAREMAERSGRRGQVVRYGRVVVSSLLLADTDRARRFVARELGALAAADDATTRIRATVQVHLEEQLRTGVTAKRLGIHQNTVTYRVRQAEALLGRSVTDRRYELETALRLLGSLGD
ncbi:hypothetical protein GKE82_10510 [Conexibacter sp. W3-3-2]|uniref:PucR family transcriptional regulator n=1 Tax=Paraconexibacter algicola TaxID=2133960 RepID=A0A2T4UGU2_9ACTN|nr:MULTISPECIES: helix-turn-helix domain-containing protein [Solirubrobacterales]MTD44710.1 hypothetical protein [Conexibacter sp. W3-3-2]PTL58450.1 hypothetical protein C7Y72_01670 [Paraconexibacter algicola]